MFNTEAWQEAQTMAQQPVMEGPQAAAPQEQQQQGLAEGGEDDPNSPVGVPVDIGEGISANDDGNGTEETDPTVSDDYWGSANPDWSYTDTDDDTDFGEESDERSPDVVGEEEDTSETQSEFTDAEYQEVLDDLDNGNLDDVREFLEGLGLSDDDTEEAQDAPGVPEEDGKLVDEGIFIGDIVGGEEKVEGGLEEANNGTEEYIYNEEAYEDAQDAFESLRDAMQHGDEGDRAEALEKLQGYFGGSGKGEEAEEATPGGYDGSGIAGGLDLDQDGVFDQIENHPDMSDEEVYTYDKGAYEDAQDALKDLKHALKHGDEEDRAEALEKLQGYLGGFDKGGDEEQTGEWISGFNGDIWVDASGKAWDSPEQAKATAQLSQDEDRDLTSGDPEAEVANAVDKEAVDAPDASGAAVSGAAVGAGVAVGEAGGLDQDGTETQDDQIPSVSEEDSGGNLWDLDSKLVDTLVDTDSSIWDAIAEGPGGYGGIYSPGSLGDLDSKLVDTLVDTDSSIWDAIAEGPGGYGGIYSPGSLLGNDWDPIGGAAAGAGAVDQAIDAGTEWAGGAIDNALGIEGSGKVLENVANGNFDEALGTITNSAGNYVGEWLDNEDLGDTFGEALNHVANGDFEEAFDTAVDGVGEALEGFGEDILGGIGGLFG